MDRLQAIATFARVVESGSFARAATNGTVNFTAVSTIANPSQTLNLTTNQIIFTAQAALTSGYVFPVWTKLTFAVLDWPYACQRS